MRGPACAQGRLRSGCPAPTTRGGLGGGSGWSFSEGTNYVCLGVRSWSFLEKVIKRGRQEETSRWDRKSGRNVHQEGSSRGLAKRLRQDKCLGASRPDLCLDESS